MRRFLHMLMPTNVPLFSTIFKSVDKCFWKLEVMEKQNRVNIVHKFQENPTWTGSMIAKSLKLPRSTVYLVLKRYRQTLSVERKKKQVEKTGTKNLLLRSKVLRSIKSNPGLSDADRAKRYNTSTSTARRIRINANMRAYRVIKYPNRTEKQNHIAKKRARALYEKVLTKFKGCIIMDDETYVKMDTRQLPGRNYYVASRRGNTKQQYKYQKVDKFAKKVLIWQAICNCGLKSRPFLTQNTLTSEVYISECLQKRLLPLIKCHRCSVKFWPDLASSHYSNRTINWYQQNCVDVIPKDMNPPNCPDLRPIEKYWAIMKQKLKKKGRVIKSVTNMAVKWNKVAAEVTRKDVQRLMKSIKKNTRKFIRNYET